MHQRVTAGFLCVAMACLASPAAAFDSLGGDIPVFTASSGAVASYGAADPSAAYDGGWIFDEVRLGGTTFLKGTIPDGEDGVFVNGQLLFDPFVQPFNNYLLDALLRPRPHIGGTAAIGDGTDQVYGGLTWTFPLGRYLFAEASFGGTVHDGELGHPSEETQSLGCRALFRESAGLGVSLGRNWRVLGSVDHSSHAGLCGSNDGLTHVGGYLGYRF